ncbi:patatin-like phospholipase family protein [Nannocystis bainbridge]|uniref:Patatin-like phospholipase family protein n=1 Tax=Nannocystis bainbridge TaxID=2995303 RepID=A0ABT5EC02_9BACT|nr:patatin-like phospholipase family protein [Nannocystis bainbridge]MDC0722859.1 patatin-like phospholipase family protein [Nannocystis bainbridge]
MREFSVVFAGGGCRTFWALGAYAALRELGTTVELAGVSAGAAMALAAALDLEEALVTAFSARTAVNPRNVYPERLILGRPAFPQEAMYRATMKELLDGASLRRLVDAPRVRILQACVAPGWRVVPTVASAWWAYADRRRRGQLHGPDVPHPGILAEVDTAHEATDVAELSERVMRSSASPPVTPVLRAADRIYFDGCLVDPAPVRALGPTARAGAVLVLLNRPQALPSTRNVRYLAPSQEVPIHKWDYTSPARVRKAFDMGRREGEAVRASVERFLADVRPA